VNYESITTSQYEKVRALHDKLSANFYEKTDTEIHKTARDFWTYTEAWLHALETQQIMKQVKNDEELV